MKATKFKSGGFTLIELLLYTAVFTVAAGLLTTILVTTTRVEEREVVVTQVGQELNLILNTVQRLVRDSSLVECVNTNCNLTQGSNLKLRFDDTAKDPTCIYLDNGVVKLAEGPDPTSNQNCNLAAATNLTTAKITADSLTFTKFDVEGGHATVQIDAQFTYNSANPSLQISRSLRSAVGRVSAATFDSDILPDSNNQRNIGTVTGSPKKWKDVFLSGILGLGTYTDATEPVSTTAGTIYYNTTSNSLKAYDGSSWKTISQTPWSQNVNASGFTLFGNSTASGNLTLDSTSDATKGNIFLNPTGGNVGVGTATGVNSKLTVAGTIESTGFKLTTSPTSGHVLTSDAAGVGTWQSASSGSKFGGTGADGALSISSGTTTLALGGASVFVKNYTSISITGTGQLAFSGPNANGTTIVLKSQGNVTVTSSTVPAIDVRNMGAAGGTGGTAGASTQGANNPGGGASAVSNGDSGSNCNGSASGGQAWGTAGSSGVGLIKAGGGGAGGVSNGAGGTTSGGTLSVNPFAKALLLVPGAGGGGGGGYNYGTGGNGGRGGGALYIESGGALNISSTIDISGASGTVASNSGSSSGSGGGGGIIIILYNTLTANTGTYLTTGGAGTGGGYCAPSAVGGNGASLVTQNTEF